MAAGKYNFTIEQGATTNFEIAYKDSNNNPIDLTSYSGRLQIRSNFADDSGTIFLTLSSSRNSDGTGLNFSGSNSITPPTSGSIGIFIAACTSSTLTFNQALYDLEIYSGSSECPFTVRLIQGTVKLSKEVTRI
jgi:hypothetical protein|tara:strand:- start:1418 stop:1819 length:402 start_codon:yes stop_codon:yes gene_type:complete